MSINHILNQLRDEKKVFITRDELMEYSKRYHYPFRNVINYLTSQQSLIELFGDLYYIKSHKEVKNEELDRTFFQLLIDALEKKGITNSYFGLHTALKLNNMIDKDTGTIYLILDRNFNNPSLELNGRQFNFIKLNQNLFSFGIIEDGIRYSDPEKSILDLTLLWNYNGKHERRIFLEISNYKKFLSLDKLRNYAGHYPEAVQIIIKHYLTENG